MAEGNSLYLIGKALGHKQARTTEIYAHLADDPIRNVADRTAARIAAAMRPGSPGHVVPIRVPIVIGRRSETPARVIGQSAGAGGMTTMRKKSNRLSRCCCEVGLSASIGGVYMKQGARRSDFLRRERIWHLIPTILLSGRPKAGFHCIKH